MNSEIFRDLNFLGLDPKNRGIKYASLSQKELEERYSFIRFYRMSNIYHIQDLCDVSPSKKDNARRVDLNELASSIINSLSNENHRDNFLAPLSELRDELRIDVKRAIRDKRACYNKLHSHYHRVLKENKKEKIRMLPISFSIDKKSILALQFGKKKTAFPAIKTATKWLNKSFNQMIKRLQKRKAFSVFRGCSHLILLDKNYIPYLQVIFYYTGDITDYFIKEMAQEWCLANKCNVRLNYVAFGHILPLDWDDKHDEFCQEGYYPIDEKQYQIDVSIRNLLLPFSSIYSDTFIPKASESKLETDLEFITSEAIAGRVGINPYLNSKERKKFVKGIKNSTPYHLFYLEQVAKQFTKIPTVTEGTYKIFTYQKGYITKKSKKT